MASNSVQGGAMPGRGHGLQRFDPLSRMGLGQRPAPASRTYAGLTDLRRLLRRRRRLILSSIAIIMALTLLVMARMTPVYEATATVLVRPLEEQPGFAENMATPLAAAPNEAARIATKVQLLGSRALATRVARSAGLDKVEEFAPSEATGPGLLRRVLGVIGLDGGALRQQRTREEEDEEDAERKRLENVTDRLLQHLRVERVAESNLIDVTIASTDPERATLLANRFAQTYIKNQVDAENDADRAAEESLRERVSGLRDRLTASELAIANYRRAHGLAADRPEDMQQAQLTQAALALVEARAERAVTGSRLASRRAGTGASSPLLDNLVAQEAALGKRLSELRTYYGGQYPEVVATTAQLDDVRARIAEERRNAAAVARREAATLAAAARAREGQLARDAGSVHGQAIRTRFADVALQNLEREAETTRTVYVTLLSRLKELGGKASNRADISIVSRASLPDVPSFPKPRRTLATALVFSVIFALVLALAVDAVDDRLRSAEQVRRLLGLPTLAMVPRLPKALSEEPAQDLIAEHPDSIFAESMRNLVIELEVRQAQPGPQVVVVTSPLPDEGKSVVSTSLAAAATSIGRRAVIVDLDLRGGKGAGAGPEGAADLIAFLTDQAELDEVLAVSGHAPFAKINTRQQVVDPGGLLESPRLRRLLDELRQRFDLIVLNAPPILPVRDAKTLSRLADGTLLVIRWGLTDPGAASTAVDVFGPGIIGVVLNAVDYRDHARRAYGDAIDHSTQHGREYFRPDLVDARRPLLTRLLG